MTEELRLCLSLQDRRDVLIAAVRHFDDTDDLDEHVAAVVRSFYEKVREKNEWIQGGIDRLEELGS